MEKTFKFVISDTGKPMLQGKDFNNFCKNNKLKRGYMRVYIWDEKDPRSIGGYYKNVIIPELRKAYYDIDGELKSESDTEYRVWKELNLFEIYNKQEPNIFGLEHSEAVLVCEHIKRHASINLNYYIS